MRVLVIGATGFVGSHMVRALLAAGHEVSGFKRSASSLELLAGTELAWHEGDLLDAGSVRRAVAGKDAVVLAAGYLSLWPRAQERLYQVNVLGARHVARACLEAKVRLVYDGSAGVYAGWPHPEPADEVGVPSGERYASFHVTSMALAEAEVLRAVAAGLDAVLLHPTLVLGAGDRSFHSSWLFLLLARSPVALVPPGGLNVVAASDVARAHVLALEKPARGVYLIGGQNLSNRALLEVVEEVMGKSRTLLRVPRAPYRALGSAAGLVARAVGRDRKDRLDLNSALAEAATLYWFVDSSRAKRELGWEAGPIRPALEAQLEWLRRRGVVSA